MDPTTMLTGPISAAHQTAVQALLAQPTLAPRQRERLEMVKGAALGWDIAAIATWSGRDPRTVVRWLSAFRAGGVAALTDAPRPGRPPRADAAYRAALEQAVETLPPTLGWPFDVWTSARLSAYLARQTGTRIAAGWLRGLLTQHRFARGRPKHSVQHLQDPAEVARCEAALAAAGKKGGPVSKALRTAR